MNDAHAYEMQVQMWKTNTWGVTLTKACEIDAFFLPTSKSLYEAQVE
jgi:hypothetical protein